MTQKGHLRLAHSPDSDDLVMWWPLTGMRGPGGAPIDGELGRPRVDLEGLSFELIARDVEALNRAVIAGADALGPARVDITAISAAAYPPIASDWAVTRCGGSFGEGYGPKVVAAAPSTIHGARGLIGRTIAVPGRRTSAFTALTMMLAEGAGAEALVTERGPDAVFRPVEMVFDEVPAAVAGGRAEAGLLIHEAQLTFASLGLREVADLGAWWTGRTGLPLPLGLNVVRRDLEDRLGPGGLERVGRVLRRSVAYAVEHPEQSRAYLLMHAEHRPEWRDAALVDRYLSMYVSRLSGDMGPRGLEALRLFLADAHAMRLVPPCRVDVV